MQLIGLTGGIASGKSTIARRMEELGAERLDADQLARDAVAPGSPGLEQIRQRFGDGVLLADGGLNRPKLGELVFGDSEMLADLNAIVHPEVGRLFEAKKAATLERNPAGVLVYEVPLLAEAGSPNNWDLVVVAEAPAEQRVQRMIELRGMTEEDARRRLVHQASDAERRAIADVVIDTSGTEQETLAQVDALWARITQ